MCLDVEAEQHDVRVLYHVLLPLGAQQPAIPGHLPRARSQEGFMPDGLGADEAPLEVRVDGSGGLGRPGSTRHGPGPGFLLPRGEEGDEADSKDSK